MNQRYTDDWFSHHIPTFERFLLPFKGSPCNILEIGAYEGRSTCWLLENITTHQNSTITSVDLHIRPLLPENLRTLPGYTKVSLREGKSFDILRTLPRAKFDFIYIDGSHATADVFCDAILSFHLAKDGAIIAFDDYEWNDPKFNSGGTPKAAIDTFLEIYGNRADLLSRGNQVWIRKLPANPIRRMFTKFLSRRFSK